MNNRICDIKKELKAELDKNRYEHTIGVMYTAQCLAMAHNYDLDKAQLAGLLHDCAKCISNEKKLRMCKKNDIEITEVEQENPVLLHAKLGAFLAKDKYGITDEDVLHAICVHTTGEPDMSILDKILYIADYIEPNRYKQKNLDVVRKLAFADLDQAMRAILNDTLQYLDDNQGQNGRIDPMTLKTFEYYNQEEH